MYAFKHVINTCNIKVVNFWLLIMFIVALPI